MKKTKIIVCCHKNDVYKEDDTYMPIQVGKAISDVDLGIQGDNTGDNISHKNKSYCELTGMYWAWKNIKDADYIGLCHYRRYFDFHNIGRYGFPITTIKTKDFQQLDFSISREAQKWLEKGGCFIAKPEHERVSLFLQYCEGHYSEDIRTLKRAIYETLPTEYQDAFYKHIIRSNKFSRYNMFLMNWNQFDNLCSRLFPLLEYVEKRIDICNYTPFQQRIYGFMAERLLNMFVYADNRKVKHLPILKISEEPEENDVNILRYILRTKLRDLATIVSSRY